MQIDWLKKEGHNAVLVVVLGWGATSDVISTQEFGEYDVVTVCDYRELDYEFASQLEGYSVKYLLSWSFGVWASEQIFKDVTFDKAIAVAGSPRPIDRKYGIAPLAFDITLKAICIEGVAQFVVRMCGNRLKHYLKNFSKRGLDEAREELKILNDVGRKEYQATLKWNYFVVCKRDLIFPPRSIKNYCNDFGFEFIEIDEPHYPFFENDFIQCRIKG